MYVRERAGYDVETDPYRGRFGQVVIPAAVVTGRVRRDYDYAFGQTDGPSLSESNPFETGDEGPSLSESDPFATGEGDVTNQEVPGVSFELPDVDLPSTSTRINPRRDFLTEAKAALGVDPELGGSGYMVRFYGKSEAQRNLERDQYNAVGWAPAFAWSRSYGEWYEYGEAKGWYYGLIYRMADMPEEYKPVAQTPSQGGGSLTRVMVETTVQNADGSFTKVPPGTLVRVCTRVIPGGPTVIAHHPVEVPCGAGMGGCPEDRPCTISNVSIANLRSMVKRLSIPTFTLDQFKTGGEAKAPWYKNKWVWIGAGAVVVAGGAGVYFMRRRRG